MNPKKKYLTKDGLEALKKKHEELVKVKRPEIVQRLSDARDQGDLSENAGYTAAKEDLELVEREIADIEELLKQVSVIDDGHNGGIGSAIDLGSEVTLRVEGQHEIYRVVGEWEADPMEKRISHESPLGKALMGKKIGENVEVEAPAGKIVYTIVSVK